MRAIPIQCLPRRGRLIGIEGTASLMLARAGRPPDGDPARSAAGNA
jgi:hypothetical protein